MSVAELVVGIVPEPHTLLLQQAFPWARLYCWARLQVPLSRRSSVRPLRTQPRQAQTAQPARAPARPDLPAPPLAQRATVGWAHPRSARVLACLSVFAALFLSWLAPRGTLLEAL